MVTVALFLRLEAKAGKENAVASSWKQDLPWPIKKRPRLYGSRCAWGRRPLACFDAFTDEATPSSSEWSHSKALMAQAPELFSKPPVIERIEVLGAKLPR